LTTFNVLRVAGESSHHASDAGLELAVLGGIDQRIDTAAGEHQYNAEVIEPAAQVDVVPDEVEKEDELVA